MLFSTDSWTSIRRTFLQVADGLVVVLHLQVTLTHEEVSFDRLAVQLQSVSAVGQSFVVLLQLHVAQRSVGVVRRDGRTVGLREGTRPETCTVEMHR